MSFIRDAYSSMVVLMHKINVENGLNADQEIQCLTLVINFCNAFLTYEYLVLPFHFHFRVLTMHVTAVEPDLVVLALTSI
jgi:hypothetical protein